MKILDRYILRIFVVAFSVTAVFLMSLFVIVHFLTHIRYIGKAQSTFDEIGLSVFEGFLRYYALHLPEILILFGPYAVLFGAMYTAHHLGRSNELTPMYVVGVSRLRVTAPIFVAATILSLGLVAIREEYIPARIDAMEDVSRRLRGDDDPIKDDMGLARDAKNNVIVFRAWNERTKELIDVHVQTPDRGETLTFPALRWRADDRWFEAPPDKAGMHRFALISDLQLLDIPSERRRIRRLSFKELKRLHERQPKDLRMAATMFEHVAYPFRAFVLLLIGLPFVMRRDRRHVFAGLSACLVLSLTYFATTQIFDRLGSQGEVLTPALGAFLPLAVFACIGLILFETAD